MCASNTLTQILCFVILVNKVLCSRKYDIETESLKLYKEDVKTVLQRFRRTPDYLKILQNKNDEFMNYFNDLKSQIFFYYLDSMIEKVKEKIGLNPAAPADDLPSTTPASALIFRNARIKRRQDDSSSTTPSPVEVLDNYEKLTSQLTAAQKNALKEMAFTYTGYVIHALIKNLGSDGGAIKSTKQPFGGDQIDKSTTTEHVSVHVVTGSTKQDEPAPTPPGEGDAGQAEAREGADMDNDLLYKHKIRK